MKKLAHFRLSADTLIYILLFCLISLALVNSFRIDKPFSADGVSYFRHILDRHDFTRVDWSRQFANYLSQWPLVIAVRAGIRNIPVLSAIFSLGIYFQYILSFGLCIYATRKEERTLLLFPIISMVGINLTSDYILAGEHHAMVLLSWPVLLLLLRRKKWTWLDGFLLWSLIGLFSRTYQTAIIPALLFTIILTTRLYHNRKNIKQVCIGAVSLILCILTIIIALYFIINPRSSGNKDSFSSVILMSLKNPEVVMTMAFTFLFSIGLIFRKKSGSFSILW